MFSGWQWATIWSPLPLLLHSRLNFICMRLCGAAGVLHTPVNSLLDYSLEICRGGVVHIPPPPPPTSPHPKYRGFSQREVIKIRSGLSLLLFILSKIKLCAEREARSDCCSTCCHTGAWQSERDVTILIIVFHTLLLPPPVRFSSLSACL